MQGNAGEDESMPANANGLEAYLEHIPEEEIKKHEQPLKGNPMKIGSVFMLSFMLSCSVLSQTTTLEYGRRTDMKIKMTSVFVDDPTEAFTFYTEILGFEKVMFEPEARLAIVASPEDPEGTVLLLEPNDHPAARTYQKTLYGEGIPVLVLGTKGIEKEYQRLTASGVVFKTPPTQTEWGTIAQFDDTCGNWIQIHQD